MSALGKNWSRTLDAKRIKLCGKDAKLELFDRTTDSETPAHTLTDGWSPRQQGAHFGFSRQWDIDVWKLTQEQMDVIGKVKLHAHGQVITFRVETVARKLIGQHVIRMELTLVGGQS